MVVEVPTRYISVDLTNSSIANYTEYTSCTPYKQEKYILQISAY